MAFFNYFDNLTDSLNTPILQNWTTQEKILPIYLQSVEFNSSLLQMPKMLTDFIHQYKCKKEIFDLQKGHVDGNSFGSNKNSIFNSYIIDIFLFITVLIFLIFTTIVVYLGCKHANLKSLVTSIALQQIKGMDAASEQDRYMDIYCMCKMQWYTIAMLLLILLGLVFIVTTKVRKPNLFGGHLLSNVTKVMLFISDAQSYVPVELCKVAGSIHLFKLV